MQCNSGFIQWLRVSIGGAVCQLDQPTIDPLFRTSLLLAMFFRRSSCEKSFSRSFSACWLSQLAGTAGTPAKAGLNGRSPFNIFIPLSVASITLREYSPPNTLFQRPQKPHSQRESNGKKQSISLLSWRPGADNTRSSKRNTAPSFLQRIRATSIVSRISLSTPSSVNSSEIADSLFFNENNSIYR